MKKFLLLICLTSFGLNAQVQENHRKFNNYKNTQDFNQGVLDAKRHFHGTGDFVIGLASPFVYFVPSIICYATPPKDKRFISHGNPNNEYLFSNSDYYQGYRYGATKKKRKRLLEGTLTTMGVGVTIIIISISNLII